MSLFPDLAEKLPYGVHLARRRLALDAQRALLDEVSRVLEAAPPYRPQMRTGAYVINRMSNCGALGWISDRRGYRYEPLHPETSRQWPPIPPELERIGRDCARNAGFTDYEPDACLINIYDANGKLNLHRDYDEADFRWPVVSFSLGAEAEFLLGGFKRTDPTQRLILHSGDILVFGGPSRLRYHGVRKIFPGTSPLDHAILPEDGRINLTLRRAR
jgi:alkylated DNA repair protein (DNA oxidative demethylase)